MDRNEQKLVFKTDSFGTVPVLFDTVSRKVGADFSELGISSLPVEDFDKVAFWEAMIWDNPLGMRTMSKRVLQLPSGSNCEIDMTKGQVTAKRWEYFMEETSDCPTEELLRILESRLYDVARAIWDKLPSGGKILLPLSGGVDSRLLACYLVATGDPKRIEAVTFAFSKRSFEYRIAAQVCRELEISQHHFHQLNRSVYAEIASDFWSHWLGGLTVAHAHLYSYLRSVKPENSVLVSGFLADPVMGWAAEDPTRFATSMKSSKKYKGFIHFADSVTLSEEICHEIQQDLYALWKEWKEHHIGIGFDEYIYFTQRQSKAYMPLLQIYRRFCRVSLPFADPCLMAAFLSAPYELRKNKNLTHLLIERRCPALSRPQNVSSSLNSRTLRTRLFCLRRQWSMRSMTGLSVLTGDRCRWISPFATEDVFGAMRVEHRPMILKVLAKLQELGILTDKQSRMLARKPLRAGEVTPSVLLLTLLQWMF